MNIPPRWQKVISDLWKNKSRSLLTVASIAVGLLAIGIITNLYFSLNRDMTAGFKNINPANIQFTTTLIDQGMIDHLGRIDGVKAVEGSRTISMQVLNPGGTWDGIDIQSRDYKTEQIGLTTLVEGTKLPGKNQIVLSNNKISSLSVGVGDWVTLQDPEGNHYKLQVVGIVQDQMIGTTGSAGGFFLADTQGYVNHSTLKKLHAPMPDYFNKIYITVNGDAEQQSLLKQIGSVIYKDLEKNNVTIISYSTRTPTNHPNVSLINAIVGLLFMLTFLIVFLSGTLITNTLQFLLTQQMQQVGVMKSIGATRRQIVGIYVALITIYGLIAFAITAPATSAITEFLMQFLAKTINFSYSGYHPNFIVLLIQVFLALVVPLMAGIAPILKGTNLSVQEALSGIQQQTTTSESWIDHQISRIKGIARPNMIALRNVFRNKGRLALTLVTLSVAGAVFISVFSVRISFMDYISKIGQYFLADLNISLASSKRVGEIEQILYSNPKIKYVEPWSGARALLVNADGSNGDSVNFTVMPNGSDLITPIIIDGRWLDPADENAIVLNDSFKTKFPDVKVGNTIRLNINNHDSNWVVVGFYQLAGNLGGLSSYVNMDYFDSLPGQVQKQASVYRVTAWGALDSAQEKALASEVQTLLEARNIKVSSISTASFINDSASDGFNVLVLVLMILAILIALVGSIGLTGTMSMNIMERTREIGIMRSIGASDNVLTRMVLIEGLLIGWVSFAIGALLSFPMSRFMSNSLTRSLFGSESEFIISFAGYIIWFVVVSILSILASLIPARNATRLTIREVLAYE
jgi:putative ABC transport system permease protein